MSIRLNIAAPMIFAICATSAAANSIAGIDVSDSDWHFVVDHCEDLEDLGVREAADLRPSMVARLSTTTVVLESLTRGDCVEAGLIDR